MKNIKPVFIILITAAFFTACSGDHPVNHGKDSSKNPYNTPPVMEKPDTTKGTPTTTDNSASGGTKIKDTAKADSNKRK